MNSVAKQPRQSHSPGGGRQRRSLAEHFGLALVLLAAAGSLLPVARQSRWFLAYALALATFGTAWLGILLAQTWALRPRLTVRALERALYLSALATSLFGPSLPGAQIGPFSLFPFRAFVLLASGLAAASLIRERQLPALARARRRFWPVAFLALWLGWGAITGLWCLDAAAYLRSLANLVVGTLFALLTVRNVETRERLSSALLIWGAATATIVGMGLVEHASGVHLPLSRNYDLLDPRTQFVPTAVFKNPNDLATTVALTVPVLVALAVEARRFSASVAWAACALCGSYVLVATGSRANLAANALALLALAATALLRPVNRRLLLFSTATLAGLAAAAALLLAPLSEAATRFAEELSRQARIGTSSVAIRLNLLRNALLFLSRTHGLGVGLGNAETWVFLRGAFPTNGVLNLHNWWLEMLTELGAPFFVLYAAFFASLAWRSLAVYLDPQNPPVVPVAALFAALFAFPLASISSSSVMSLAVHWLVFGVAIAALLVADNRPSETSGFER